jgi:hypothetical protein
MTTPIADRVARPMPERPVQQVKPAVDKHAEAAAIANQQARSAQDAKVSASRNADKGRHVDRYA